MQGDHLLHRALIATGQVPGDGLACLPGLLRRRQATVDSGYLNGSDTTFHISVDGDPQRLDEIQAAVDEELAALLSSGPSATDPFPDPSAVRAIDADNVAAMARRLLDDENLIEVTRQPGG